MCVDRIYVNDEMAIAIIEVRTLEMQNSVIFGTHVVSTAYTLNISHQNFLAAL
jgi:hypothetical protein